MTKNARILGIRLDDHTNRRLTAFESQTLIEGVSLARAALNAALDTYEATGSLSLPLKIVSQNESSFKSASGIAAYETAQPCATTAASTSSSPSTSSPSARASIVSLPAPPILGTVVHDGLNPTPHLLNESTTPAPVVPEPRRETRYPKPKKPRRKNGTED